MTELTGYDASRTRQEDLVTDREKQAIHELTVIAEACEEQWRDRINGFDAGDVLPFIRETGERARRAISKLESEGGSLTAAK